MVKINKMKSVQYLYMVSRKIKIQGRLVNVYLESLNEQLTAFGVCEPIITWTRNKHRATLVAPTTALHLKNQYSLELNFEKHSFEL